MLLLKSLFYKELYQIYDKGQEIIFIDKEQKHMAYNSTKVPMINNGDGSDKVNTL
jgi:hypothetical protein